MYYERKLKGTGYCLGAHEHFWVAPEESKKMLDAIMANDDKTFKKLWSKYEGKK